MERFFLIIDHPRERFITQSEENSRSLYTGTTLERKFEAIDEVLSGKYPSFRFTDNGGNRVLMSKNLLRECIISAVKYQDDSSTSGTAP